MRTHLDGPNVSDNTQAVTDMTIDHDACVVGVDFGTLSGRAVVVRVRDGAELGTAVHEYRHGVVDRVLPATGRPLPPEWALQVPADYLDVLRTAVPQAVEAAGISRAAGDRHRHRLHGLHDGARSPPTARRCASCAEFAENPHAYVKLWRHHAAQPQADRINELARAAQGAVARAVRRTDLLGVGVREGTAGAGGGA